MGGLSVRMMMMGLVFLSRYGYSLTHLLEISGGRIEQAGNSNDFMGGMTWEI